MVIRSVSKCFNSATFSITIYTYITTVMKVTNVKVESKVLLHM